MTPTFSPYAAWKLPRLLLACLGLTTGQAFAIAIEVGPSTCASVSQGPSYAPGIQVCAPNYVESNAPESDYSSHGDAAGGTLSYFYEAVDPHDELVTLTVSYDLFAQATGTSFDAYGAYSHQASASITVGAAFHDFNAGVIAYTYEGLPVATDDTGLQTISIQVETNQQYNVLLQTDAESQGVGDAISFADPMISVDPTLYPDTQIVVSAGISNTVADIPPTAPVPEPEDTVLLAAGLAALALRVRRTLRLTRRATESS